MSEGYIRVGKIRTAIGLLRSPRQFLAAVWSYVPKVALPEFDFAEMGEQAAWYLRSILAHPPIIMPRSRIVFVVSAAGSPHTLATTNYIAAWMDGFRRCRADARVIGWTQSEVGEYAPAEMRGRLFAPGLGQGRPAADDLLARADVVIVHYSSALVLDEIRELAPRARIVVWSLEHPESPTQGSAESNRMAIEAVTRLADGVVTMSDDTSGFWLDIGFEPSQLNVIVTAMPRTSNRPNAKNRIPGFMGLYSGNLANAEVLRLPEIARIVRDRIPEFELHVCGDSTPEGQRAMRDAIDAAQAGEYVIIHPPLPREKLRLVQQAADVLLSFQQVWQRSLVGFPSKVGEYLDSGTPTVCNDVPPLDGIAIDGVTAYVAPLGDVDAFAAKVIDALEHPEDAQRIGRAGRARIRQVADSKLVARDFLRWLDGLPWGGR